MRSSCEIRREIETELGTYPPLFQPAEGSPLVLECLWQQTLYGYLKNPLPAAFKEKLFVSLSRYSSVPRALVCHSCALRPTDPPPEGLFELLATAAPDHVELEHQLAHLESAALPADPIPLADRTLETALLRSAVGLFLGDDGSTLRPRLRAIIGPRRLDTLSLLLAYVRTCQEWVEDHPELGIETDPQAERFLRPLLELDPRLEVLLRQPILEKPAVSLHALQRHLADRDHLYRLLEASTQRFDEVLDRMQEVFVTLDGQWRFLDLNRAAEQLAGRPRNELIGRRLTDQFPIEEQVHRHLRRAMDDRLPAHAEEYYSHLDRFVEMDVYPTSDGGLCVFARDVTERRRRNQELLEALERLRLSLAATGMGTWDHSPQTGAYSWDDRCRAMLGLAPDAEISYEAFLAGLHPEDRERTRRAIQQALEPSSGGDLSVDFRVIGATDGIERWVSSRGRAFFDEAGTPLRFIGTLLDITPQKRIEYELQAAIEMRDEFLAIASHELRTPLTALGLQLDSVARLLARPWSPALHAQSIRKVNASIHQMERLNRLVDSLLEVSHLAAERLVLRYECFDLAQMAGELIERLQWEARNQGGALVLKAEGPVTGIWDRGRLEQVLANLVSNAVKYAPGTNVEIEIEGEGQDARMVVRDHGIGIDEDDLVRIFSRFERAVSSMHYGGLGLGLYVARQIVEAHGGSIRAVSARGKGSTFTVQLPRRPGSLPSGMNVIPRSQEM